MKTFNNIALIILILNVVLVILSLILGRADLFIIFVLMFLVLALSLFHWNLKDLKKVK